MLSIIDVRVGAGGRWCFLGFFRTYNGQSVEWNRVSLFMYLLVCAWSWRECRLVEGD